MIKKKSHCLSKGTKKEKITAVANLLMENPESCLRHFDTLVKWTSDNNHNFALKAS